MKLLKGNFIDLKQISGADACTFKKGDFLIRMDDKLEFVYYLISGQVRREIVTEYGVESVLSNKTCGNGVYSIVGMLYLYQMDELDISRDNFIAITDCACVRLPVNSLKQYLRNNPELLEDAVRMATYESLEMTDRYLKKVDRPLHMTFCSWILDHMVVDDEVSYLPRRYSNIDIAKHLGIHKVTVSRLLRALREEGAIVKNYLGQEIVDQSILEAHAAGSLSLKY